jgi:hypothetical protein
LLVVLAGCNAAFGISHQDPMPIDAPPPDGPPAITAQFDRVIVGNDAQHLPFETSHIYTTFEVSVFVVDDAGESTPIDYDDTHGTFSVPSTPGGRTRIQLRFGATIYEYQWDAPALKTHIISFGRLGATSAPAGTTIVGTDSPIPSSTTTLYTTGLWKALSVAVTLGHFNAAWTGALVDSTANDQLYVTAYDSKPDLSVVLDRAAPITGLEMTSGANMLGVVALPVLPLSSCVAATGDTVGAAARLDASYPAFGAGPAVATLDILSLPAPDLGPLSPWTLARTPGAATAAELDFAPIFPGSTDMASMVATRTGAFPDGTAVNVSAISYVSIPDVACPTPPALVLPPQDVAIPNGFVIGGVPLSVDGLVVPVSAKTVELSWQPNGVADVYEVQIEDVTGTTVTASHLVFTRQPHATLGASDFVSGHRYLFIVRSDRGLPEIANGDLTVRGYPAQLGVGISPAFTAQ